MTAGPYKYGNTVWVVGDQENVIGNTLTGAANVAYLDSSGFKFFIDWYSLTAFDTISIRSRIPRTYSSSDDPYIPAPLCISVIYYVLHDSFDAQFNPVARNKAAGVIWCDQNYDIWVAHNQSSDGSAGFLWDSTLNNAKLAFPDKTNLANISSETARALDACTRHPWHYVSSDNTFSILTATADSKLRLLERSSTAIRLPSESIVTFQGTWTGNDVKTSVNAVNLTVEIDPDGYVVILYTDLDDNKRYIGFSTSASPSSTSDWTIYPLGETGDSGSKAGNKPIIWGENCFPITTFTYSDTTDGKNRLYVAYAKTKRPLRRSDWDIVLVKEEIITSKLVNDSLPFQNNPALANYNPMVDVIWPFIAMAGRKYTEEGTRALPNQLRKYTWNGSSWVSDALQFVTYADGDLFHEYNTSNPDDVFNLTDVNSDNDRWMYDSTKLGTIVTYGLPSVDNAGGMVVIVEPKGDCTKNYSTSYLLLVEPDDYEVV